MSAGPEPPLELRPTTEAELDLVVQVEADPDVSPWILRWPRERHAEAIAAANEEHLILAEGGAPVGFGVLSPLDDPNHSIEIKRVVVFRRGAGVGRRALPLFVERAFAHGAHRVWLDLVEGNERAERAYLACGFTREGVLRESLLREWGYASMVVMSILRSEWEARNPSGAGVAAR